MRIDHFIFEIGTISMCLQQVKIFITSNCEYQLSCRMPQRITNISLLTDWYSQLVFLIALLVNLMVLSSISSSWALPTRSGLHEKEN